MGKVKDLLHSILSYRVGIIKQSPKTSETFQLSVERMEEKRTQEAPFSYILISTLGELINRNLPKRYF